MKKNVVKAAVMAIAFTFAVVGVNAQRGGMPMEQKTPEKMAEIKTDKMDQELDLTDAQEKKIYAINLKMAQEFSKKMNSCKEEGKPQERPSREQMEERMKQMKEQKDSYTKEVMSLLTDDQKIGFAKMVAREEMKRQRPHKKGGDGEQAKGQEHGRPQPRR